MPIVFFDKKSDRYRESVSHNISKTQLKDNYDEDLEDIKNPHFIF